jgi:excisionase family DNA binding protein
MPTLALQSTETRLKSWSIPALANRWNCHPNTVRGMIHEGKLRAFKVGREFRVTPHELKRIEENA